MAAKYLPPWTLLYASSASIAYALVQRVPERAGSSFALTFIAILLTQSILRYIYQAILWPKVFSPLRHLPQPKGGSFLNGHFRAIMAEPTGIPMRRWINEVPNDGLIRYMYIGNIERVFLTSPKAIGEVLVSKNYDFIKPKLAAQTLGRLLGIGVLLAEGEEHRIQRKNLMPAFSYRHVKQLVPTFWSSTSKLVRLVTAEVESAAQEKKDTNEAGTEVEFAPWLNRATLDIIGIAGMGFDFGALDDPNSELNAVYRRVFGASSTTRNLAFLAQFLPFSLLVRLPLRRNIEVAAAAKKIRATSRQLIENKQRVLSEKGTSKEKDILAVALESGGFSVDNLVDQTMTFLAAGHETTATATQWAMVSLSQHPGIQKKLREEVRDKLPSPDEGAKVTAEMLDNLPYLHAVCQEVLRFWAPVPFTRRQAKQDTTICGQVIPKGTDVVIVPWAVNWSKDLWGEDAEEFKPERWLGPGKTNSGGTDSAYANLTFLHGPRSCIGQAFAKHELECLLAAIVGRFEVDLVPKDRKIEFESGIVTRPKGGLKLRMKPLEGW